MRTTAKLLLLVGAAVVASLPLMPPAGAAGTEHATIANFSFSPNPVKIPVGTTLEWTNTDGTAHTISADDGSFGSASLARNATFSHTFDQPGPVAYHCAIHPSMTGTVQVEAAPTTTAPTTAAPTTSTTAAPTTTTTVPTPTTAAPAAPTTSPTTATPRPTAPKPIPTTRATVAPTTTAPVATTPVPPVAAPTIDAPAPETTATVPLPEQAAPPAQVAVGTPSGGSGNGGAVGLATAGAAVLLLGGGGFWVWRRRISAG